MPRAPTRRIHPHLLVRRLSNKPIAAGLGLQPGTVRIYVSSILSKLAAANRTEAAHIARTVGLV